MSQRDRYTDVNSQYSQPAWGTFSSIADPNSQWAQAAGMDIGNYARNQFFGPGGMQQQIYDMTMNPTSQFYAGQQALAQRGAEEGIQQAGNAMAGLGGLYSGAMLDSGNRAAQDAFLQATNNTNQMSANMLNNLWNQGLGQSFNAGGQMANIGAGIYGQGLVSMGEMGNPIYEYNPTMWDRIMQGGQLAMQALPFMAGG